MSSVRRRLRDESSDDDAPQRPSGRRSAQYFKEIQEQQRQSGKILADVPVSLQQRPSVGAVAPVPVVAPAAPTAVPASAPKQQQLFKGLVALAPAALDHAGKVQLSAYATYVKALKEDGVSALLVNGPGVGECSTLSVDERKQIAEAVVPAGLPVCVHVTSQSIADTISLAQHAKRINAAAIAVSIPQASSTRPVSIEDAIDFINEVSHQASEVPLLVWYNASHQASFTLYGLLKAIVNRGLVPNVRGFVAFGGVDTSDFTAAAGLKGPVTDAIYGGGNYAAATFLGATSVAGSEFSFAAPLFAKLTAAAQKGDVAAVQPLQSLAASLSASISAAVGENQDRLAAAAKVLTSLRCSVDFGAIRPPGPRVTVSEASRLSDALAAFVQIYTAQTKPAAPAARKTIKSMDGYLGKLNAKILERVEVLGPLIGVRNLKSKFPHLSDTTGRWRPEYPTEATCNPARHIDHTLLKAEATEKEIAVICQDAIQNNFYAVCVNGSHVEQCLDALEGSNVKVAAVIGFPLGAGTSYAKAKEARELVQLGAHEIDMVMNIGAMKDGNFKLVYEDVKAVVQAAAPGIVKVIFETCLLSQVEIIDASILCVAAGAQFVKTSTGFNKGGATAEVLDVMLAVVGTQAEVKAAGGVRDYATAAEFISAGVSRIGTSSGVAIMSGKPAGAGY